MIPTCNGLSLGRWPRHRDRSSDTDPTKNIKIPVIWWNIHQSCVNRFCRSVWAKQHLHGHSLLWLCAEGKNNREVRIATWTRMRTEHQFMSTYLTTPFMVLFSQYIRNMPQSWRVENLAGVNICNPSLCAFLLYMAGAEFLTFCFVFLCARFAWLPAFNTRRLTGSDWLPHGEAVFRIDLGAVYPGVKVRCLTEWRSTPGRPGWPLLWSVYLMLLPSSGSGSVERSSAMWQASVISEVPADLSLVW
jgi:hypothetical protein